MLCGDSAMGELLLRKSACVIVFLILFVFSKEMKSEGSENGFLNPLLQQIIACSEKRPQSLPLTRNSNKEFMASVFIKTKDPEQLSRFGIHPRTAAGDVVTATLPISKINKVAGLSFVAGIEPSLDCMPLLDESIPLIGVDSIWNGSLGGVYQGEGVLVGIYDSGIDWTHPDFIDSNGNTRILYLWDQTDESGIPPAGFGYGSEYDSTDINDEIDGSPTGLVQGKDVWGHGTYVAGIAAGNGRASGNGKPSGTYIGVAPEANLIVVKGGDEYFQ
jgi:subtilisin family serine protease